MKEFSWRCEVLDFILSQWQPDLTQAWDEEITEDISRLSDKYLDLACLFFFIMQSLSSLVVGGCHLLSWEFEHHCLDKLVAMAYEKYMSCRGPSAFGGKSASSKMAKQAALAFVKRLLERCQEFQDTGKSCFSEPLFRDMFISGSSQLHDALLLDITTDGESGKQNANTSGGSLEVRVSAPTGHQQSPSRNNLDVYSSNALLSVNNSSGQTTGKEHTWSNRVTKQELLDDVGGTIGASTAPSGVGISLPRTSKGKRSKRDRESKGNSRVVFSRNGTTKIGRPASVNIKGERKSKTKPKQKSTQLSVSINGLLNKLPEQSEATLSSVQTMTSGGMERNELSLDAYDETEAIGLSHLQLPRMDVLGVPDDLGGQGQDISSWLNIEDDGLHGQDDFLDGLEIPMDNLADLNMIV